MFAPISAMFSLLFFASTLANGIRLVELPSAGGNIEFVAGYTSGGLSGFASTAASRSLLLGAYAVGAHIDFIDEQDRTAWRITAPSWALPVLLARLPALFKTAGDAEAAPKFPPAADFRAKVEEEIRNALLGPAAPAAPYATDGAFILFSGPAPDTLREALGAIPKRSSANRPDDALNRLPAERTLRFKSDLAEGAVIFASPIPGAYYRQWYLVLLLDRLIHRIVPLKLATSFALSASPYYYRLELPVPAGQFAEPAEENLLQELQRLQFTPASAANLAAARAESLAYLDSRPVREWFASYDMIDRRQEGIQWIQAMTADDMRVAARDLLIMNRVVAMWSPRTQQLSVSSQPLSSSGSETDRGLKAVATNDDSGRIEGTAVNDVLTFPVHADSVPMTSLSERLSSGVSFVESTANAVFVSSGAMTRFDHEFTGEDLKLFEQYRPERILVFATAASMAPARQLWTSFSGAAGGATGVSRGKVSSGDLSALFILKTILDLKVIQAGWWQEVSLDIAAGAGTDLQIHASEQKRAQVLDWIKGIANAPVPDAYFNWAREVAIHRFAAILPDLQALTWERDPQGVVQPLETVSTMHVQDVARIYF